MEESQGWLIDLGMVLIVSMMERQDSSLCVCACARARVSPALIDHVPGGGGRWELVGRGIGGLTLRVLQTLGGRRRPKSVRGAGKKKAPPARIARV